MSEFSSDIAGVASTFAQVSSKSAASSNLQRLQIAEGNVRAATDQIGLEESAQRRAISRSLAQFQGAENAARAYRGATFAGSGDAAFNSATASAADAVAIVESNAAAKEVAVLAQNQVILEDPFLAAIQGANQGIQIGSQIANSLLGAAETTTRQTSRQLQSGGALNVNAPPTFQNFITQTLEIPGLDLGSFFKLT